VTLTGEGIARFPGYRENMEWQIRSEKIITNVALLNII
jgi:hypothetical protein